MIRRLMTVAASVLVSVFLFSSISFAAGFSLPDQSASAMGMASAFVGQADDASAVWYNPAGLTQLDGTRIMGGFVAIYPNITHENTDGTTDVSSRAIHVPVHFYVTRKMSDTVSLGLGINNPFGLATNWSNSSETSGVATLSEVVSTEINPNIAYKITDNLSVAAGVAYVHLWAALANILPPPLPPGVDLRLSGSGDGWGGNIAALYKATDQLNFGLSYRSRIKIDVDGNAEVPALGITNSATTSITLPDLLQLGASYKATDRLTLNLDLGYTWWSTYDKLDLNSATFTLLGLPSTVTQQKQWKDVWNVRIGGQYKLSEQWKLRAGYVYDQNPVRENWFETRVPDSDRQGITVGTGYSNGSISVDVAYMYLHFNNRTITDSLADGSTNVLNGTYKSDAHLLGVTVGYKF